MEFRKISDFNQTLYVTEVNPSEGHLTTCKESNLTPVKDIHHEYHESKGRKRAVMINCSFFNQDGSRNGPEMRDMSHKWNYAPYEGDAFIQFFWNFKKKKMTVVDSADFEDGDAFAVGVNSLITSGSIDDSHVIHKDRQPRSAMGQKEDGTIIFMVTDGRPYGLTFKQTADFMLSRGCKNAVMLDGGGSSTMVINGKVVNRNENRAVYDALIFYSPNEVNEVVPDTDVRIPLGWPTESRRISSPYGPREIGDGFHDGLDILPVKPYTKGDRINPCEYGKVVASYYHKTYGNMVIIDHYKLGISTLYAHLDEVYVSVGDIVDVDMILGAMGNTGTKGVHLHVEVRDITFVGNESRYWSTHNRRGGWEFFSSQDPLKYFVESKDEDVVDELAAKKLIMNSDKWKQLVYKNETMEKVEVKEFLEIINKL